MGNEISQQEGEEGQFHDQAVTKNGITLESPDADSFLNSGTAASNCQPKHLSSSLKHGDKIVVEEGLEVVMKDRDSSGTRQPLSPKHRRDSAVSENSTQEDRRKRQHTDENDDDEDYHHQQQQQQKVGKKMTYVQMAKMGYQELVNAIVRPPRADYKVRQDVSDDVLK